MRTIIGALDSDETVAWGFPCGCRAALRPVRERLPDAVLYDQAFVLEVCPWHAGTRSRFERLAGVPLGLPVWIAPAAPDACRVAGCLEPVACLRREALVPAPYLGFDAYTPACFGHRGVPSELILLPSPPRVGEPAP